MYKGALAIVILGALNWLIVGLFHFDFIAALFGSSGAPVARVCYSIIGLAGIFTIGLLFRDLNYRTPTHKVTNEEIRRVA